MMSFQFKHRQGTLIRRTMEVFDLKRMKGRVNMKKNLDWRVKKLKELRQKKKNPNVLYPLRII